MSILAPPPLTDSLVDVPTGKPSLYISKPWALWFQASVVPRIENGSQTIKQVSLAGQTAAIATTPVPLGSIPSGLYRVNIYARVTTAASVASSLTPSLSWTDGGVAQSYTFAAMTGNLTTTWQSAILTFHADATAPISYAVAYSSIGTTMTYRLDLAVEFLGMSLQTHLLERENWSEVEAIFGQLPELSKVIVVTDETGAVKGRWVLMPIYHAEFLESDGTIGVARRLWRAMRETAKGLGVKAVYTGAVDDNVRGLLDHVGAKKLPGDHYLWEMH